MGMFSLYPLGMPWNRFFFFVSAAFTPTCFSSRNSSESSASPKTCPGILLDNMVWFWWRIKWMVLFYGGRETRGIAYNPGHVIVNILVHI